MHDVNGYDRPSGDTAADPLCPVCTEPVRSGNLVWFEHGELFHAGCGRRENGGTSL
jgi:hypothetical protein